MSAIAPPPLVRSTVDLGGAPNVVAQNAPRDEMASTPARSRSRLGSVAALCTFGLLAAGAGFLGFKFNTSRRTKAWYRRLSKSKLTPPDRAFGIVWPVLYGLSALSAWRVWRTPPSRARTKALGMWGAQLVTNAAWTPIFFGAKRPRLAMGDLAGLAASLGGYALEARKVDPAAAWLTVPYLGWTCFAGYLNATIIAKNGRFVRG